MKGLRLLLLCGFAAGFLLIPSCAGDSTKKAVRPGSDGGAADSGASGESASGSGDEAGTADNASRAGGSARGGSGGSGGSGGTSAGTSGAQAGAADVAGTAGATGGASGAAGETAAGGEGGLACGAPGSQLLFACGEISAQWSPHYDPRRQTITFEVGSLAHGIVHGFVTYFYDLPEAGAVSTGCAAVTIGIEGKTLSVQLAPATAAASRITITYLELTDDCGNLVRLNPGSSGCHGVQFTPSDAAWTVGCGVLTGTSCPSCA